MEKQWDEKGEEYKEKLKQYQENLDFYNKNKKRIEQAKVKVESLAVLSDFIGCSTNGRINPYTQGSGYWGHKASYVEDTQPGIETWAQYFSAKMTRDNTTLGFMKEFMPKTLAKYEEIYKEYVK